MMQLILEVLTSLVLTAYYWVEAIILAILPATGRCKNVQGQTVLITGAGSGLGRLLALRFAQCQARLILWDVNERGNKETAQMVRNVGAEAHQYVCDLSNREQVYDTADQVKREVGDVDILINNAGIVTGRKFLDSPDQLIEKTMEVNINAHFWTVKSFLPAMLTKNHGHIVNIASSAGSFGVAGLADYCASKFAAVGFDESLRMELIKLGKTGVNTTVVCPYYINTGMFDGVKTRFPRILPILDQDYAADKITEAILTNQVMLYMPRILYVMLMLKGILPSRCQLILAELFGVSNTMDEFRGRPKTD